MKTMTKVKSFDCVKMKNDLQAKIYAETKDMNTTELLEYFNRETYRGVIGKCNLRKDMNDDEPPNHD